MRQSINELRQAGSLLAEAEQGLEEKNYLITRNSSRNAIRHAALAVALTYVESDEISSVREGILLAMERMPSKLWIEALRLLEILRSLNEEDVHILVDLAREAVEIASAIVITEII